MFARRTEVRRSPVPELVITRVFDAPRSLVFEAWTESESLKHWWGPKGFTWVESTMHLRPNGTFHYCMRSPDGHLMWGKFVYREIMVPQRLVFVVSFSDEKGGITRHPMIPTWPLEVLNTLTFSEYEGRTRISIKGMPINATESERETFEEGRKAMERGFAGTFDQLDLYLAEAQGNTSLVSSAASDPAKAPATRDLVLTRVLDAPSEVVFKAWIDPKQVAHWWGPLGFTNPVCKLEVRPGGAMRIDMRAPDGTVYPMSGTFQEIDGPRRIVFTSSALDASGSPLFEVLTTATFTDQGNKTKLTVEARVVKSTPGAAQYLAGMDEGWNQSIDRLEAYVAKVGKGGRL